ncbi:MAG: hypothetical protein RLZZ519_2070, partial [Bacteroidota bacterium]
NQVRAQNDYWYMTNVANANQYGDSWEESWYCADTTAHLQQAADTSRPSLAVQAIQPPKFPPNLAIAVDDPTTTDGLVALLGGYPNPFHTDFMLKYYLHANARVRIRLLDLNGRVIEEQNPGKQGIGLHLVEFSQPQLANGMYVAELSVNGRTTTQRMIKY